MCKVKLAISAALGFLAGHMCSQPQRREPLPLPAVVEVHDTLRIVEPVPMAARPLPVRKAVLPVATSDTLGAHDSATVAVPTESVEYGGDGYRAWVSGWQPRLDSIYIDRLTVTERIHVPAPRRRFTIGIQAGYGLTPAGPQPYIGIGVAYRLY